jgi:hypothetical protein
MTNHITVNYQYYHSINHWAHEVPLPPCNYNDQSLSKYHITR